MSRSKSNELVRFDDEVVDIDDDRYDVDDSFGSCLDFIGDMLCLNECEPVRLGVDAVM